MIEDRYTEYQYEQVNTNTPLYQATNSTKHQLVGDNSTNTDQYFPRKSSSSELKNFNQHCKVIDLVVKKKLYNMGVEVSDHHEKGSQLLQFVAVMAANLCVMAAGAALGWTSSVLLMLKEKDPVNADNPLGTALSESEASWVGSLSPVGSLLGTFIAGYLAEKYGRRVTLLSSVIPYTISWILIATGKIVEVVYVARIIGGMAIAFAFTVIPMYCGEIAETSIRGTVGSFLQIFITIGLEYSYSIGPYVSYQVFWIACAALPIIFFALFFTMPESPYYLAAQNRYTDVVDTLARLRGKSTTAVKQEADEIQAAVEEAMNKNATLADLFTVKANLKALIFTCLLVAFQQTTGINVVLFYSENIFASAGDSGISSSLETIIVGLVQLGASCVTPFVVDRLGRRLLLIMSGIGTAVSLGTLGLFFYLKDVAKSDVTSIGWLPIVSLMVFIALYSIGWGPLPWVVMGEMFSSEVKSKASGITVFVCWGLAFITTKYFSDIAEAFGQHTAFWIFAICCVISVLFTIFILPETKGKSLREIQEELAN